MLSLRYDAFCRSQRRAVFWEGQRAWRAMKRISVFWEGQRVWRAMKHVPRFLYQTYFFLPLFVQRGNLFRFTYRPF